MQVESSQTTMAPDPSMEPASANALKSSRTSTIDAGKYPDDGPDGANAFSVCPPRTPAERSNSTSRIVTPVGTSYTPGFALCPLTPTNFNPREPFRPADLNHSTPRIRICGTLINVSTLLMTVGFCHSPTTPGNGGLFRGSARWPSIASISALSSPQM